MKVFSLYDKDKTFLGAFPSRDMCVTYAKVLHPNADGWDYDVIEEYLSKSPLLYSTPYIPPASSTTPINHNHISPNPTKFVHNAHPNDPKPYFDTYGGVKAEPYKNVSAYWEKK